MTIMLMEVVAQGKQINEVYYHYYHYHNFNHNHMTINISDAIGRTDVSRSKACMGGGNGVR